MKKADIRILIVEDDESIGKALEEGLKRSGYTPKLVTTPSAARHALKLEEFHGLIIDCMLPQKNGVDFAHEINGEYPNLPILLTSGVYKDKAFAHDALIKSKARAFFNKPFDMEQVIKAFDDAFVSVVDVEHQPLYQLFALDQYSRRDKITAIENTTNVHGYDLPWVYCLLMDTNVTGRLEIRYDDGKSAALRFNKGRIDEVQFADTESFFGVLLVEKGFATPQEIEHILEKSNNKRLGERLVDESFISPHAVSIVQYEQMVIRISKTIRDGGVEIRFHSQEMDEAEVYIDGLKFTQLLSDWICSKVPTSWLRSFHLPWLDNPLIPGADSGRREIINDLPAGRIFNGLNLTLDWPRTLDELTQQNPKHEADILRAVHFFLLQRVFRYGPKKSNADESLEIKRARLERIWGEMKDQNFFEVLGVNKLARPSDINRTYHELAKALHPDRIPATAPKEIREINEKIFLKITDAYETLSNEARRQNYTKTLESGLAEEILQAETKFEEGMRYLDAHRFQEARKLFEKVMKMHGRRSDSPVFYIWALVKEKRHRSDRKKLTLHVADLMQNIAHEDRHSPQYFFVRAMYYELTGQVQKSYQTFKHVLSLDPNFIEAKKEISYIKQHYGAQKRTFTDEVSVVFTKLLGRKSG